MLISNCKNTWGSEGGLEASRKDLYVVDFTHTMNTLGGYGSTTAELMSRSAESVQFPQVRISSSPCNVGRSQVRNFPSKDIPIEAVRLELIVPLNGSLLQVIRDWYSSTRKGRDGNAITPVNTIYSNLTIYHITPLLDKGFKVNYATYLPNCWCASYQLGDISWKSGNQYQTVILEVYPQDIVPILSNNQNLRTSFAVL